MLRRISKNNLHYLMIAVIIILMTPFLIGFETSKNITIKYDGKTKQVATTSRVPKLIIMNAGIKLEPGDGWKFENGHKRLEDGCTIEVVRGVPFSVIFNGQTKTFKSAKETVGAALKDAGVSHNGEKIYPHASHKLQAGMKIYVINKGEQMHLADTTSKPPVTYIDDKNMAAGAERIEKPGKPAKVKIVSRVYKDAAGKQITEELGRVVVEPAENSVVRRGLARSIKTPQGYKRYSKHITCEATAYTHTGYRTATGIMPYVGVVAVDPRYIPLGTKMFIPGYGMAVAADTGGDMIHHRIDVFLNTEYECIQWGRRNVEVYILEN